jgi:hypothetical protein
MSNFTCESAVNSLREKGYTLTESTIEVNKYGIVYKISSFLIKQNIGRVEIYDRSQYASDHPQVGIVVEGGGMNYGDNPSPLNYRASCLDDILKHIHNFQ